MKVVYSFLFLALFFLRDVYGQKCSFTTQRLQCGELACDIERGICALCNESSNCYPGAMRCVDGRCVVGSLASNFSFLSGLAMFCAFCVCSVAVVAGVGGGGILVPMFCALMKLPIAAAVGLSQSTICGQSTLNMIIAVRKRYPNPRCSRPLINYQYVTLLIPLGFLGTLVGGILSKVCPDLLRLILLFVLLVFVLHRTVQKMIAQYQRDRRNEEAVDSNAPVPEEEVPQEETGDSTFSQPQFPLLEIICILISFFITVLFNVLRSKNVCGGTLYILFFVMPILINLLIFFCYRWRLSRMDKRSLTFSWNNRTTMLFPLVALIAGGAAALLGIGGGLVLGFVLYEVGLIPEEASVTGGMVTFFLSFSNVIGLLIEGHLLIDYGGVLFALGMGSTALGQFCFMREIKKRNLRYLIIASLVTIIGGSLLVLTIYGIYNAIVVVRAGGSIMGVGRICPLRVNH
ncbi:Transmembrane protein TauE-like [Trypanosoma melophagium]|uniref:Transmembrane protein TauE-like n=1 Tax=Trypanosoma melophagium TaxID=715481 RepID=UPI00351AA67F|nr:Transmembrane protein TauE-like [Trypanosoma melophagium]